MVFAVMAPGKARGYSQILSLLKASATGDRRSHNAGRIKPLEHLTKLTTLSRNLILGRRSFAVS